LASAEYSGLIETSIRRGEATIPGQSRAGALDGLLAFGEFQILAKCEFSNFFGNRRVRVADLRALPAEICRSLRETACGESKMAFGTFDPLGRRPGLSFGKPDLSRSCWSAL
jgi:hypothetical protein